MTDYVIKPLSTLDLTLQWARITPLIERAVKDCGDYTLDGLLLMLQQERFVPLVVGDFEGVIVIGFVPRTYGKVLWIEMIGGKNFPLWMEKGFKVLKTIAKNSGCIAIETQGRLGWKKHLKVFKSFKPKMVRYSCEV